MLPNNENNLTDWSKCAHRFFPSTFNFFFSLVVYETRPAFSFDWAISYVEAEARKDGDADDVVDDNCRRFRPLWFGAIIPATLCRSHVHDFYLFLFTFPSPLPFLFFSEYFSLINFARDPPPPAQSAERRRASPGDGGCRRLIENSAQWADITRASHASAVHRWINIFLIYLSLSLSLSPLFMPVSSLSVFLRGAEKTTTPWRRRRNQSLSLSLFLQ